MSHQPNLALRTGALAAAAGLALAGVTAKNASAADGAAFYKGKTVTYIVATGAGGGYDFYGRLVAKYMQKYLPGSTFVVKNVPGAGHIIGANQIANAKPNGQTLGIFNTGLIFAQLLGRKGVKFDLTKMTWIGKAATDPRVIMVAAQTSIKTLDDLKTAKTPVRFATAGVGSSAYNDTMMLAKALGWNMKMIFGYDGTDAELAMRRGEIDASIGSLSSATLFVNNGYGRFIAQIGGTPTSGVPMLANIVKEKNAKSITALIGSQAELARFTAGPGGIPADRTAALIAAYKKSMEDKELIVQAEKAGRPVEPLYGEDVAKAVRAALDQPPETVAMVSGILNIKPPSNKVSTKLGSVSPDGREITFKDSGKDIKSKISGSRTKITINGKPGKRSALKAGMSCEIDYKPGGENEPITIDCK
jgi:tripartite-type tricarboxylate transporter receptor subunit TctC